MDSRDYNALIEFINRTNGTEYSPRSPVIALHDEPLSPGYATVAVVYSRTRWDGKSWIDPADGKNFRYAVYGYCPYAETYGQGIPGLFSYYEDELGEGFRLYSDALMKFATEIIEFSKNSAY